MPDSRKFNLYTLCLFAIFVIAIGIAGYFNIGLLSDDYLNINGSIHSSLTDKLTGNLAFTNSYHLRTTYYLSMQSSNYLHKLLGFAYDDFLLYRIQNLLLFLFLAYLAGRILLLITNHLSVAVITSLTIIIFPNNINNICWTAARVDLLCGIFYLLALYFAFKSIEDKTQTSFVSCILSYMAALLTKETAISIPIITAILIYAFYGKEILKKNRSVLFVQTGLILIYVFYKLVILQNNMTEMLTLYQASPLANAPGILARAAIALSIPLDFLSLNTLLRERNLFLMSYLAVLYGTIFYLISVMVRHEIYKYIGYMALSAGILLIPNIYVGYIRTQMILIPFIIISILAYWAYDHQLRNSIHINKLLLKVLFGITVVFWSYWTISNVADWSYSYQTARVSINNLMNSQIDENKRTIVIGNPGRYRQAFLFDKLTGAYNYWKNEDFVIKDTINDLVQTGALDDASLRSKLNCVKVSDGTFEISTTGLTQYFYMEGFDNEKIKEGFRNSEMSVEFKEFNLLNKPKKLILNILKPDIKCLVGSELNYFRIN